MTNAQRRGMPIALTAILSLWSIAPAMAQNPKPAPVRETGEESTIQPGSCRRVNISEESVLNVRLEPGGKIVGTLSDRALVTIVDGGENGWVSISSPFTGYVYSEYLTSCTTPIVEVDPLLTSTCRQVSATDGMQVYQRPSLNGDILGTVADSQQVTIVNRGENGWVPISSPVNGYILGVGLIFCPE